MDSDNGGMVSLALPGVLSLVKDRRFYGPAGREPLRGTRRAGVRDLEAVPGGADMSRKGQRRVIAYV